MWASNICYKLPFKILAYLTYFSKEKEKEGKADYFLIWSPRSLQLPND